MSPSTFTITYHKQGTIPPVFVAGSFSSTPWEPQELDQDGTTVSGRFSKTFSAGPGTYQYKFRLGTGDWWVVDEYQETATDGQGNTNNVLIVKDSQEPSTSSPELLGQQNPSADCLEMGEGLKDLIPEAHEPELDPAVPISEISVQADKSNTPSLSHASSAAAAKVTSATSVSHDLPTPPISERGDDIGTKDKPAEPWEDVPQEPRHPVQISKRSHGELSPRHPPSRWSQNRIILLAVAFVVIPVVAWSWRQR